MKEPIPGRLATVVIVNDDGTETTLGNVSTEDSFTMTGTMNLTVAEAFDLHVINGVGTIRLPAGLIRWCDIPEPTNHGRRPNEEQARRRVRRRQRKVYAMNRRRDRHIPF